MYKANSKLAEEYISTYNKLKEFKEKGNKFGSSHIPIYWDYGQTGPTEEFTKKYNEYRNALSDLEDTCSKLEKSLQKVASIHPGVRDLLVREFDFQMGEHDPIILTREMLERIAFAFRHDIEVIMEKGDDTEIDDIILLPYNPWDCEKVMPRYFNYFWLYEIKDYGDKFLKMFESLKDDEVIIWDR